jgi:hypothetical protein
VDNCTVDKTLALPQLYSYVGQNNGEGSIPKYQHEIIYSDVHLDPLLHVLYLDESAYVLHTTTAISPLFSNSSASFLFHHGFVRSTTTLLCTP